jgi:predicted RNA-binding protein
VRSFLSYFHGLLLMNDIFLVFSKEEIIFARTTPKHKLEIGGYISYFSLMLNIDETFS